MPTTIPTIFEFVLGRPLSPKLVEFSKRCVNILDDVDDKIDKLILHLETRETRLEAMYERTWSRKAKVRIERLLRVHDHGIEALIAYGRRVHAVVEKVSNAMLVAEVLREETAKTETSA